MITQKAEKARQIGLTEVNCFRWREEYCGTHLDRLILKETAWRHCRPRAAKDMHRLRPGAFVDLRTLVLFATRQEVSGINKT